LEARAASLGLSDQVHLPGAAGPREGLGGYFQAADLFLCLSEHEGFCIPLVEAMAFDLPVVAYRAAGVPYAMGGAGVLVSNKRYDAIAELIDLVLRDGSQRRQIIEGQRRRLRDLAPDRVADVLKEHVRQLLSLA
jgi:glycosyltransferase involved in cell wall biosynthesis